MSNTIFENALPSAGGVSEMLKEKVMLKKYVSYLNLIDTKSRDKYDESDRKLEFSFAPNITNTSILQNELISKTKF